MTKRTTKAGATRKAAKKTTNTKTEARATTAKRAAANPEKPKRPRDPRLPAPGTTIVRPYKGKDVKVAVLEDGFRWEGKAYRSLSALASAITGAKSINGFLWFRLTGTADATATKPTKRATKKDVARAES